LKYTENSALSCSSIKKIEKGFVMKYRAIKPPPMKKAALFRVVDYETINTIPNLSKVAAIY